MIFIKGYLEPFQTYKMGRFAKIINGSQSCSKFPLPFRILLSGYYYNRQSSYLHPLMSYMILICCYQCYYQISWVMISEMYSAGSVCGIDRVTKCLRTRSSHVNTDCSHKVRRVEAFGGHRIVLLKEKTYCFQNRAYRNLVYSIKQR